jgi:hypothetical protein
MQDRSMKQPPYQEWMRQEGTKMLAEQREQLHRDECCGGCGIPLAEHAASAMVCRRYQDLLQLVIDWHTGEVQANAKLRDVADEEIERRTRKP